MCSTSGAPLRRYFCLVAYQGLLIQKDAGLKQPGRNSRKPDNPHVARASKRARSERRPERPPLYNSSKVHGNTQTPGRPPKKLKNTCLRYACHTDVEQASLSELLRDLERKTPISFKAFLRHMRFFVDLFVKDYALREQLAIRDTGFSVQEVEDFRQLFLESLEYREGIVSVGQLLSLSDLRRALPLTERSPALGSVNAVKGEAVQLLNGVSKAKPEQDKNMVVNFPQFLRIAKQLLQAAAKEKQLRSLSHSFTRGLTQ